MIDTHDFSRVVDRKWLTLNTPDGNCYAASMEDGKFHLLHRVLMDAQATQLVDHVNGNGLDNRRANLRIATASQNQHNKPASRGSTSPFKGVSWNAARKRWVAQIKVGYKTKFLGRFDSEIDAAHAYDDAAKELHGEFGRLNQVGKPKKALQSVNTKFLR